MLNISFLLLNLSFLNQFKTFKAKCSYNLEWLYKCLSYNLTRPQLEYTFSCSELPVLKEKLSHLKNYY